MGEQGFVEGGEHATGSSPIITMDELQLQWEQLHQRLGLKGGELTPILLTFGVLLVTLLIVYWGGKFFQFKISFLRAVGGKKRETILLVGLSGGGKTTLYYELRDGSSHKGTVTSMEPNEGHFILHSEAEKAEQQAGSGKKGKKIKPVHIVDVPGHPRLKPKIDEFLPQARGIVFVVDALDFMPQVRLTAEYLYDLLTKAVVVRNKIPVLLACNKMDKVTAHSVDFIRRQLEKEIEKLRSSRKSTSDADIETDVIIGSQTGPFELSQCVNKVSVCELSAVDGKTMMVERFIRDNVKA